MRVQVDPQQCQGHARCWDICPEVFTIDDDGYSSVSEAEVPPALEGKVREAANNCPERAISLI
jgi:ferredoxin